MSLTRDEVLAASGLSAKELGDLERFGLVVGRSLGNTVYYGDDALLVTQLAAGFMSHGVEARHLRMYKVAAEREAGVFEQLVMPLLKQRNPGARRQATERLDELAGLGVPVAVGDAAPGPPGPPRHHALSRSGVSGRRSDPAVRGIVAG